jgi:hypothetical protein
MAVSSAPALVTKGARPSSDGQESRCGRGQHEHAGEARVEDLGVDVLHCGDPVRGRDHPQRLHHGRAEAEEHPADQAGPDRGDHLGDAKQGI